MTIVIPEIYHDSPPGRDSAESTGAIWWIAATHSSGTGLNAPGDSLGLVDGPGSNPHKGRMGKGNRASELN